MVLWLGRIIKFGIFWVVWIKFLLLLFLVIINVDLIWCLVNVVISLVVLLEGSLVLFKMMRLLFFCFVESVCCIVKVWIFLGNLIVWLCGIGLNVLLLLINMFDLWFLWWVLLDFFCFINFLDVLVILLCCLVLCVFVWCLVSWYVIIWCKMFLWGFNLNMVLLSLIELDFFVWRVMMLICIMYYFLFCLFVEFFWKLFYCLWVFLYFYCLYCYFW